MSGGRFQYYNDYLCNDMFCCLSPNYGEKGFSQSAKARQMNPMEDKMISELVWDVFCLIHSFDWYQSGDNCEETYRKDIETFKKKWLQKSGKELVEEEISKSVEELKQELMSSLMGIME